MTFLSFLTDHHIPASNVTEPTDEKPMLEIGSLSSLKLPTTLLDATAAYLDAVRSRLPPTNWVDAKELDSYCTINSNAGGTNLLPLADKNALPSSTKNPIVEAGVPVSLNALAPVPGSVLPAVGELPQSLLPPTAVVTYQWHILVENEKPSIASNTGDTTPNTSVEVRPGITIDDQGGAFEVVAGDLRSPVLKIIPWPNPEHTLEGETYSPSKVRRIFSAYADITIWWPGIPEQVSISTPKIAFKVQTWAEILKGDVDKDNKKVWDWQTTTPDPLKTHQNPRMFFNGLFDLSIDTIEPAAGRVINLSIRRADQKPSLPQTVTSMIQSDPNFKIQAGIDMGAILNKFKDIGSLISGKPIDNFDGQVTVEKTLNSLASIPLAVAVNGTSVAKTITPNSPVSLPNLVTAVDGSGISGIIPIGGLMTRVDTALKESNLVIPEVDDLLRSGLSLLPIPILSSMKGNRISKGNDNVTVSVKMKLDLKVPGASDSLTLLIDLGSLTIKRPIIAIPQVAMLGRHRLDEVFDQDVLLVPDPDTMAKYPTVDSLKNTLETLSATLKQLSDLGALFPEITTKLGIEAIFNIPATIAHMVRQIASTTSSGKKVSLINPYKLDTGFVWLPGIFPPTILKSVTLGLEQYGFWDGESAKSNVSSVLWIGAPAKDEFQFTLELFRNDRVNFGKIKFPIAASNIYSVRALQEELVSDGPKLWDEGGTQAKQDMRLSVWNDLVRDVTWEKI